MLNSPSDPRAHYLLFSEADAAGAQGVWRFVLDKVGDDCRLSVSDAEPLECRERLELLAVVRGLEALDEPSRVTLVTKSRYVSRGLRRGLSEWRANAWQWERFGRLVPVRDHDLWRRMARALEFHQVDCRLWRFEGDSRGAVSGTAPRETAAPNRLAAAAKRGGSGPPRPWKAPCNPQDWRRVKGIARLLAANRRHFKYNSKTGWTPVRSIVDVSAINPLVYGYHENPFEVLGPHEIEEDGRRALAVRALSPAVAAGVVGRPPAGRGQADAADSPGRPVRGDLPPRSPRHRPGTHLPTASRRFRGPPNDDARSVRLSAAADRLRPVPAGRGAALAELREARGARSAP